MHAFDRGKMNINALKNYLADRDESITDFSRRTSIAINTIRRVVIEGKQPRKDVAKKIVRCTKNHVSLKDLGYEET